MKPAVENHQCGGGSGVEFHRRLERRADWDRRYGRRPYITVWCTGGSKFSVSYFSISQLPTQLLSYEVCLVFPDAYINCSFLLLHL
jgi:hypothetical protein